ncbi:Leucine-rich repeat-containing protein 4C [Sarcoptes scabiei]|uniref:Gem-associated protein 5 TPR domain-containing protein n=1 Tax=Sarcoptes scabiei TaxID=52283 RepID=A0A132ABD0_SARSC|nr:hypothetical protein QR98_0067840 [Sarcoptes scabiei]UXI23068.1 Leucine-rich repeat-containing protein 4C [Sarcoptes scabiei]
MCLDRVPEMNPGTIMEDTISCHNSVHKCQIEEAIDADRDKISSNTKDSIDPRRDEERKCFRSEHEFSFGAYWNWFLPSCVDIWSQSNHETTETDPKIIIAYGAKSFLLIADVVKIDGDPQRSRKSSSVDNNCDTQTNLSKRKDFEAKIHYRDILNVFGFKGKNQFLDPFRFNNVYITTVVFDKTFSIIKHGFNASGSMVRITPTKSAMLFVGNSDGEAALYDCQRRITLHQNLPFSSISRSCCKNVVQKKILSAAWLHFQTDGPTVFYSLDTHVIVWKVKQNSVQVLHDNDEDCYSSRFNSGHLQIACLASLPAECTENKVEHKLAIGYMNGKIVIVGFNPSSSKQTSLTVFSESGHNDDICSLSFAIYSWPSIAAYRQGLLCSVSRDGILKVWSCSNQNEVAEYRVIPNQSQNSKQNHHHQQNNGNWFTATFLPRSNITSNSSYEIIVTNTQGDFLSFTLPDKSLNSKLRVSKALKTFNASKKNKQNPLPTIGHSFIVFSLAINYDWQIAVSISMDYKLILWDLVERSSLDVLYSFANGAMAIDCCETDKRIAIAFGNTIFVLDFSSENSTSSNLDESIRSKIILNPLKIGLHVKNSRLLSVIWNQKYHERLGSLLLGTSLGEIYQYNLSKKSTQLKSSASNSSIPKDSSKIYGLCWVDSFLATSTENETEMQPVVLSIHKSGNIMVNRLDQQKQENLEAYLQGYPNEPKLKHTAALITNLKALKASNDFNDYCYLMIGNHDGTVDILKKLDPQSESHIFQSKVFRHLFRFRAFNGHCISMSFCANTKWLAISSLHDTYIACYLLDELDRDENTERIGEDESEEAIGLDVSVKLAVKKMSNKRHLHGHRNRISATTWSPFNHSANILMASCGYDSSCIVWNLLQNKALAHFNGHRSFVYTIKWCHFDINYLFSGGEDNFFIWNWTKQPNEKIGSEEIKIISLKQMLQLEQEKTEIKATIVGTESPRELINDRSKSNESEFLLEENPIVLNSNLLPQSNKGKPLTIKALFPVNNQIENNTSKKEFLDDIKWLIKLKSSPLEEIPEKKLDRILLYSLSQDHIEKLVENELNYHRKHKNLDAQYILQLFLNPSDFIQNLLDQNECDPMIAMFAGAISKKLFQNCCQTMLGLSDENGTDNDEQNKSTKPVSSTSTSLNLRIRWNNYSKEIAALIRLYCLNDFQGAIDFLIENNLFREAIILSHINLASNSFISNLMFRWHQFRLQQNNYEGAIKCLISSGQNPELANQLLQQRRTLCSDTSTDSIIKQYDEIINLLEQL